LPLLWFLHRDLGRFFEKCLPALFFLCSREINLLDKKNRRIKYGTQFLACLILLSSDATNKNEPKKTRYFCCFSFFNPYLFMEKEMSKALILNGFII
ncbi:MAG: hypothetical protein EBV97_09785, partial [Rhodobacteraceae bacterium]|nr:hypothetical protein [Paracoccaceae bacterium]